MTARQWMGAYYAVVARNDDPTGAQRVTLQIPQVLGTAVSQWASPVASRKSTPPAAGTVVTAMFLGGDINHPLYLYGFTVTSSGTTATQFNQAFTGATTVTVTHNLGQYPQVSVIDTGGNVIVANIQHTSVNACVVSFSAATSGTVLCTVGGT